MVSGLAILLMDVDVYNSNLSCPRMIKFNGLVQWCLVPCENGYTVDKNTEIQYARHCHSNFTSCIASTQPIVCCTNGGQQMCSRLPREIVKKRMHMLPLPIMLFLGTAENQKHVYTTIEQ